MNATETDGTLLWGYDRGATNFDFSDRKWTEQTMSYGVVPSSASEGGVAVATKPGEALSAGVVHGPICQLCKFLLTARNNCLSFEHWFHCRFFRGRAG